LRMEPDRFHFLPSQKTRNMIVDEGIGG
jgi:hypothetical protein